MSVKTIIGESAAKPAAKPTTPEPPPATPPERREPAYRVRFDPIRENWVIERASPRVAMSTGEVYHIWVEEARRSTVGEAERVIHGICNPSISYFDSDGKPIP